MKPILDKASITFRIGSPQWMPAERFDGLLDLFSAHAGVTDELSLFLSVTHAPQKLEDVRERCALLKDRLAAIRERVRLKAGVNVLATLGHTGENLANSLSGGYARMVDIDGNVAQGSFCPNDAKYREEYIRPLYEAVAASEPDHIWIDDDVRMIGHGPGVLFTCFCDECLTLFDEETGTYHSRGELATLFSTGSVAEKLKIRLRWIEHNSNTFHRLFAFIENAAHAKRPEIEMGFMDAFKHYEGFDLDRWAKALSGPGRRGVKWRPAGGGDVSEGSGTDSIFRKAHSIGREAETLPASGVSIQSEIENFPYECLSKSAHFTALETALYCAAGATGAAYNVLSSLVANPLDEFGPHVERLRRLRPFLDLIVRRTGREKTVGIHTGWTKASAAAACIHGEEEWFSRTATMDKQFPGLVHAEEMFRLGLPPAYSSENAVATALSGNSVLAMPRERITAILSSGVYMDVEALLNLNGMGFSELTGFVVKDKFEADTMEIFREHPLNGRFSGWQRDCRQAFFPETAYALEAPDGGGEALTRLIDYGGHTVAECGMGIYRNSLGGRVCVCGYYPWRFLMGLPRACQTKAIFRWLSNEGLPAYINSYHRVSLWARPSPADGTMNVALLNASMDPADHVELMVRTAMDEVRLYDMCCSETRVPAAGSEGACRIFVLPAIEPWQMRLLTV